MGADKSLEGDSTSGVSTTYASGSESSSPPDLRFIHYNDVYHVEQGSREPVGGIARFQWLCNYYQDDPKYSGQSKLLTFFSGDAFNPSLESSVTKGKHMVDPLNNVGTDVACLGNHDLDFGIDQFQRLAAQCKFPWLCANVLDPALGEDAPLGKCKRSMILESSSGIKIGVIGVVEREWLATINTLPPNIKYVSASETVSKLAPKLRADGAEMVIVLSHQRQPNDEKLAGRLEPGLVDIILGGHDHDYAHSIDKKSGIHILRSGTDFQNLSYVEARRRPTGEGWDFEITRRDIVSSIPQDELSVAMVDKITAALRPRLERPVGYTCVPLDARFTTVRKAESNLGNFVCDLVRFHYNTDCCIMAAGTIRGDQIYPPGVLKVADIMNCFPFEDPCVVVQLKGSQIVDALENGVYTYPALEGRFPQVSGINFTFDPKKPAGQRCFDIKIGGQDIQLDRDYKLATRDYMVRGKDGFTSLMLEGKGGTAKSLVSDENGMLVSMILRQYFMSIKVLGRWKLFGNNMKDHWAKVQNNLLEVHPGHSTSEANHPTSTGVKRAPTAEPSADEQLHGTGEARFSLVGRAQQDGSTFLKDSATATQKPGNQSENEESDSDEDDDGHRASRNSTTDRQSHLIRKVARKWYRLAGFQGKAKAIEAQGAESNLPWTKGIAPRLEGRIKIVGDDAIKTS